MLRLRYGGLSGVVLVVAALVCSVITLVLHSTVFVARPTQAVAMTSSSMMEARLRGALWGYVLVCMRVYITVVSIFSLY